MIGFFVISGYKAWRYSHMPVHSRLELYPVPKEGVCRAEYGGSYFEEPEWWNKRREINKINETKDILMEMIFIRKLFQNQRSLWWASYTFHLGIYVMFAWTLLLILNAYWAPAPLTALAQIVGVVGFGLATLGSLLLIMRRLFDATLRKYTTPQEYFNILFIFCVLATGIAAWTLAASPYEIAVDILHFRWLGFPTLVGLHLILLGIMLIYIPLSKMSHYVGKYFAFHKVLWDNDPNQTGSKVNQKLKDSSTRLPQTTWSAPHINSERGLEK
jgi:nitrate reductase gamma subunit